jgi:hypothetical protein
MHDYINIRQQRTPFTVRAYIRGLHRADALAISHWLASGSMNHMVQAQRRNYHAP